MRAFSSRDVLWFVFLFGYLVGLMIPGHCFALFEAAEVTKTEETTAPVTTEEAPATEPTAVVEPAATTETKEPETAAPAAAPAVAATA